MTRTPSSIRAALQANRSAQAKVYNAAQRLLRKGQDAGHLFAEWLEMKGREDAMEDELDAALAA